MQSHVDVPDQPRPLLPPAANGSTRSIVPEADDSVRARAPIPLERAPGERRIMDLPQPDRPGNERQNPAGGDQSRLAKLGRHSFAIGIGLFLFILVSAAGYLYLDYAWHFQSTDDAFIAARQFGIA